MFDKIIGFVSAIISPVTQMVDQLHTSTEEKMTLKNALTDIQSRTLLKLNEFVVELSKAQAAVINSEMKYGNWLTRSWRPITMLVFVGLTVMDVFGLLSKPLSPEVWSLVKIGLGGYVVGRSAEKIVKDYKK